MDLKMHKISAKGTLQDKAQRAVNGKSFTSVATPYWSVPLAPIGQEDKHTSSSLIIFETE